MTSALSPAKHGCSGAVSGDSGPGEEKCIVDGCETRGVREPGYRFFVCGPCLDRFGDALDSEWARREAEFGEMLALRDAGLLDFE
jgi:hypothetical protein